MTTETTKRQRQVFPTQEVIHKFSNETQLVGRNQQGNVFFEDKSLYSYGHHYEMARHVLGKKGEKVVFLNDHSSSVTTEKHKSWTRQAVPADRVSFPVLSFDCYGVNLLHIIGKSKSALDSATRARNYKLSHLGTAKREKATAIEYFKLFSDRIGTDTVKIYKAFLKKWNEKQFQLDLIDGQAKKDKADQQREVANQERQAKQELYRIERARSDQENLDRWKLGENIQTRFSYHSQAFLRVKGEQVETSQGARVSVKAARVLYKLIVAGKEIRTFDLEGFKVIGLTDEGQSLKVGCHTVPLTEIHRVGKELEGLPELETSSVEKEDLLTA